MYHHITQHIKKNSMKIMSAVDPTIAKSKKKITSEINRHHTNNQEERVCAIIHYVTSTFEHFMSHCASNE